MPFTLPKFSFNDFVKHPAVAMLIILLIACSTLFFFLRNAYSDQIDNLKHELETTRADRDSILKQYIYTLKSDREEINTLKSVSSKKDSLFRTKIVEPVKASLK